MVPTDLTRRERETLSAIERRLGNAEIAAEFGVSVRTVESHIATLRRKLGAGTRAELVRAARDLRGAGVPVPPTSFVGRERHADEVRVLLGRTRWVTVTGPAGTGKTRLALEVAAAGTRAAVVAELEHACADDVPVVVAKAVGVVVDPSRDPVQALDVVLGARPHLLVLDNADRVGPATRALVRRLLVAVPGLAVLTTSRMPLGDGAETVYVLPPLDTDGPDAPAHTLFLDRAQAAAPGLVLTGGEREAVSRLCARLDGLPLAIELAAARVRHLPVAELEARLGDGLGALERDGGGRHDTLEAAFAWTWDLLDGAERDVLCRLAALPRTFDLDLAEAVTFPGASRVVLRLLDRSLIVPVRPGGSAPDPAPRRFRILAVLRHFALARSPAAVPGEVRRAHAAYHARLAGALVARARVDDSVAAVAEATRLCPELAEALRWAVREQSELALPLARTIAVGIEQYGTDIVSMEALTVAARDHRIRAELTASDLFVVGQALCYHDLDLVTELAELAAERIDGPAAELAARHLAGLCAAYRDRGADALAHLGAATRLAEGLGDRWQLGGVLQAIGIARMSASVGDPAGALEAFTAATEAYAEAGDALHVNNARYMMARSAAAAGRPVQEVAAWAQQCVDYAAEKGNAHQLAHALLVRAPALERAGAERDLATAAAVFESLGDLRCLARASLSLAALHTGRQRLAELDRALGVAQRLHDTQLETQARATLVDALWEDGDHRRAAVEFGYLAERAGVPRAEELCPRPVVTGLAAWPVAVAEGRARALRG
ncbi:ATP-binding protein [Prauserella muralis]|uniref:Uncharacterized protein n=1 Tax=Prauserella muralis TaxID=588067 RepID=A0A2V4B195_9PSEU|nr:LuxR C-terminal-related transcriptional regulator [Prauserella muralis]PXY27926.1 hypothetical protein BAY60_16360 [Prauserella muralis]TWE22293.1 putative ATPase [Prauserella muralis]